MPAAFRKITFLVIVFLPFAGNGQSVNRISVKAGMAYSLMQMDLSPFSELRRWYDRGVLSPMLNVEVATIKKRHEFGAGLQLLQKGFYLKNEMDFSPILLHYTYYYHLTYLELPLMYRYRLPRFAFGGGVVASWMIGGSFMYKHLIVDNSKSPATIHSTTILSGTPLRPDDNYFDAGMNLSAAYKFTKYLEVEFSWQRHVIRIRERSDELAYNASVMLGLRYTFMPQAPRLKK